MCVRARSCVCVCVCACVRACVYVYVWTRVWRQLSITQATKLAVYRAVVLSTLLYGCETGTCYRRHLKKLDQFHLRCLRRLLGISWEDRVTNHEVLHRSSMPGVEVLIMKAQLDGLVT